MSFKKINEMNIELSKLMKFHHIGIAVKSFENPVIFIKNLGYECESPIVDPLQNVEIIMCNSNVFPNIELIRPITDKSPVSNYLKHFNETMYHICYVTENVTECVNALEYNNRVILISKEKQAALFSNRKVSFYYIVGFGLIEFLEQ
ncbi:lactoylglutathione lyase [Candidatus Magnetobacterium bavaricum]|uniref:Lactoylglutathione lyase n=1 Tax=Candidatus Magnetobacterium bavaricum TaxID=29290 RepID=A0A0F3GX79_9BACT|nr:lactoylglutathione lyase [Candidatus Magnetobacterium bavaricum]